MQLESTPVFERDVKKLDKNERRQLKAVLGKVLEEPESGKPLEYCRNVFSKRTGRRRLVYQLRKNEEKLLLLLYKSRDEVYEELRKMGF